MSQRLKKQIVRYLRCHSYEQTAQVFDVSLGLVYMAEAELSPIN
jgi:DNA-directed RNA polymerase specialized sigma24 family protein